MDSHRSQNTAAATSTSSTPSSLQLYTDHYSRITKKSLFMILALWMELFPIFEDPKPHKKAGVVLVRPDDILYAVDCTRDGIHGIARLLMNHHDMPEGCKVFVSRKPCSFCAKLLVQSKVQRVFYLPFEPENDVNDKENVECEKLRVDMLFKTSTVGYSLFVPKVEKAVLEDLKRRKKQESNDEAINTEKKTLRGLYWDNAWMRSAMQKRTWSTLDNNMIKQVSKDFESTIEWMARILVGSQKKADEFSYKPSDMYTHHHQVNQPLQNKQACTHLAELSPPAVEFDPVSQPLQCKQALHLIKMAEFLAERSDDPKTGVGAVITNKQMEIKSLGWNGFPLKASYGEFARASHSDEVQEKKYPYVIHAEQNALLFRNDKSLEDGILFVTKTPCDECTPLIEMKGIKTVVIEGDLQSGDPGGNNLSYTKFDEKVKDGIFTCFERKAKIRYNLRPRPTSHRTT